MTPRRTASVAVRLLMAPDQVPLLRIPGSEAMALLVEAMANAIGQERNAGNPDLEGVAHAYSRGRPVWFTIAEVVESGSGIPFESEREAERFKAIGEGLEDGYRSFSRDDVEFLLVLLRRLAFEEPAETPR